MTITTWDEVVFENSSIEIIDGDRGNNYPKQGEFSSNDYCLFLNANNVTKNGFNFSQNQFISKQKDAILRKGKLNRWDIVLTTRGTVGNLAIFDDSVPYENIRINSGMVIMRVQNPKEIDVNYIYHFLNSVLFRDQIGKLTTGSAQPQLPIRDIKKIKLIIPPLPEQRAIAEVLSALDDKIELNRRMNQTLEELAQALFKHWFVDNPEREGWERGRVGDDFNLTMGQSPPGSTYNEKGEGDPFFQGRADFGFRYPSNRVYCTAPTRYARSGDTLVSVRAPVGDINLALENCAIGRGVASIRHKSGSRSFTYYSMQALQKVFKNFEMEGTVFGSISKDSFLDLKIVLAPEKTIKHFEEICFPIDEKIEMNEKEIRTLIALRDTLLPKLMSGQVRIDRGTNI